MPSTIPLKQRPRWAEIRSLGELNDAIAELLTDLNQRTFKKLPGCRMSAFEALDRLALRALPAARMPIARFKREWTPAKLIAWGERIGVATARVVRWQMEHRPHPEQGYRACLGLQRLARQFGEARLEAACARAISIAAPTYQSIKSILASGLDRQAVAAERPQASLPLHDNVRGPEYYH